MADKSLVIWDLSGTLFKPKPLNMSLKEQEDYSLLFLLWSGKKEASYLDTIGIKVLTALGKQPKGTQIVKDHTGKPLPEVMVSYLAGRINSQEALDRTMTFFNTWAPQHISQDDQQKLTSMFETLFDPLALATSMSPIGPAADLLSLTAQKNDQQYILSNWDHDSFIPFYARYKDSVLAPFSRNHIVISADTGYVKPQRGIYEWLLAHHTINKEQALIIDDQIENVEAAKAFGIDALEFKLDEIGPLEAKLKQLGLI